MNNKREFLKMNRTALSVIFLGIISVVAIAFGAAYDSKNNQVNRCHTECFPFAVQYCSYEVVECMSLNIADDAGAHTIDKRIKVDGK